MIESATLKLTLWYLAIIMALSLVFSVALYRESNDQLTASANRQRTAIGRLILPVELEPQRDTFDQYLADQLAEARRRLVLRLTGLNFITLVLGGAASYGLARRTLRPIEDSLEAQGRFTADASHELRTPLTAMRSEIEVALRAKELTPTAARELLTSNLEEIAKLENLSAGLLRLARFENGLDPAAVSTTPAVELFEAAAARHAAPLTARKIKLTTEAPATTTVTGDRDSLIELIAILLDNAIKYSPPGGSITLRARPAAHLTTQLTVTDSGLGIKASDLPHIFDRFYRADPARAKDHPGGYGLGLSIAKRIVDVHQGTIDVSSRPDHGTTFTIKLPHIHEPAEHPFFRFFSN